MAANPRKQTVVILVVCILLVGGVAFYVRGGSWGSSAVESAPTSLSVSSQEVISVKGDWQKQFLGDNATSTTLRSTGTAGVATPEEKLTATDLLGRAFLTKYGELRQSGLNTDSGAVTSVMNQVSAESVAGLPAPKTFSVADIKLSASSTEALSIYGRVVMKAFQAHMPKINEAEVASEAFASNDMRILRQIDPIIVSYKNLLSILVAAPVPVPIASHHIALLDGVSMAVYNAEALRHIDTDPVRGLAGVTYELVALQNISDALSNMNAYFLATGVKFN